MATLKQEEESISEIQNYLDTFNKEIEDPNQIPGTQIPMVQLTKESVLAAEAEAAQQAEDGGTYFVDQSGQYYYQSNEVDGGDGTTTLVAQDGSTMVSIPSTGVCYKKILIQQFQVEIMCTLFTNLFVYYHTEFIR